MNRTEDRLHEQVWNVLRHALPHGAVCTSHENRQNGALEGARRKKRGCIPGWPDMQVLWKNRVFFIELKAPGGALSKAQRDLHEQIEATGHDVAVCRSVEAVLAYLESCGIPLKAEVMA